MSAYSIIQKSQLERTARLDPEYYQTEYLELVKSLINTKSYKQWADINGRFITGPFGSEFNVENYTDDAGYRYVRGKDVKEFFLLDNDNVHISQKDFERLKKYSLQEGDILVSVVGTLGNTSIVDKSAIPAIFSCKSTVFRANAINPFYFIAYLNCKYGKNLLRRSVRGHVQTGLNIEDLKSLLIYIPENQEKIASLVIQSRKKLEDSKLFYLQAEESLLKELGLVDFKPREDLSFIVNLSDAQESNRVDSDFFQPKYEEILRKLNNQTKTLIDNFEILRGKNFTYSEDGEIGVIKTKQLGKQFISFEVEDKTKNEIVKKENLPVIKNSDVVFASMGVGSLGKTNIFYEFENEAEKFTIDSTLRIFRSKKDSNVLPEVLKVYLSSWIGQELIYKYVVGSSGIISIYENYLEDFPLPVMQKATQKKIAELVKKSHESRKKSKELLEQAKKEVEEMIEKGGEN